MQVLVVNYNSGGVQVLFGTLLGFIPASQLGTSRRPPKGPEWMGRALMPKKLRDIPREGKGSGDGKPPSQASGEWSFAFPGLRLLTFDCTSFCGSRSFLLESRYRGVWKPVHEKDQWISAGFSGQARASGRLPSCLRCRRYWLLICLRVFLEAPFVV